MVTLKARLARYDEEHEFLRGISLPEEDRAKYSMPPWSGGFRWFRSSNVVCLEKARELISSPQLGAILDP